jgi:prevent-host-death family protein
MSKTINLRDANQGFSHCIREVEAGEEFVITRNGKRVARHMPPWKRRRSPELATRPGRSTSDGSIATISIRDDIYKERIDRILKR